MSSADRDRGRVDDVALDPVRDQQAMDPEAVEPGLLDDEDANHRPDTALHRRAQAPQKGKKPAAVAARDIMPGDLLAARRTARHEPARAAEFERDEERAILRPGDGGAVGREVLGAHRSPPG